MNIFRSNRRTGVLGASIKKLFVDVTVGDRGEREREGGRERERARARERAGEADGVCV